MQTRLHFFLCLILMTTAACNNTNKYSAVTLSVTHEVNGQSLLTDSLCYTNAAGNAYLVNEVQWFLSRLEIEDEHGAWIPLRDVWYIDTDLHDSQSIKTENIPIGLYQTLRFTFGLNDTDNQTGAFTNPPESEMFWPDELGGGYHYMKLNGKFLNPDSLLAPLAIHLGRGQNASHTEFYDNSFTVELRISFTIAEGQENSLGIVMNIENWFRNPNTYDFNHFGSAIMQNQQAQQALKENGHDVLSINTNPRTR